MKAFIKNRYNYKLIKIKNIVLFLYFKFKTLE